MIKLDTPRPGVRHGLKLLLIAACLTPLIFLLEGLLPSRENTRMDELPQLVLTLGLLGLALIGVARIAYALLTERASGALPGVHQQSIGAPQGHGLTDFGTPRREKVPQPGSPPR